MPNKYWESLTPRKYWQMFSFHASEHVQITFQIQDRRRITVSLQEALVQYNVMQSAAPARPDWGSRRKWECWRSAESGPLCFVEPWNDFLLFAQPWSIAVNSTKLAYIQFQFSRFRNWIFSQRLKVWKSMTCPILFQHRITARERDGAATLNNTFELSKLGCDM